MWRIGQEVKTSPSHGGIWGSIPQCATKTNAEAKASAFFLFVHMDRIGSGQVSNVRLHVTVPVQVL